MHQNGHLLTYVTLSDTSLSLRSISEADLPWVQSNGFTLISTQMQHERPQVKRGTVIHLAAKIQVRPIFEFFEWSQRWPTEWINDPLLGSFVNTCTSVVLHFSGCLNTQQDERKQYKLDVHKITSLSLFERSSWKSCSPMQLPYLAQLPP